MPGGRVLTITIDHAAPAEVAVQVFGRHTAEANHPGLQAAGVSVDILDVIASPDMLALRGDDPHMQVSCLAAKAP